MVGVSFDRDKCSACGVCAQICPVGVFQLKSEKLEILESKVGGCIGCNACADACPEKTITLK